MTAPVRFKQSDLDRVFRAAKRSGYEDVRVIIDERGRIEVIVGTAANDSGEIVELE